MPRNGSGVYSLPPGSTFSPNTLAQSSVVNGINSDIATDLNAPRPIVAGGTGANNAGDALTGLSAVGFTSQTLTPAQQGVARGNIAGDLLTGTRNAIINGDFDFWQRSASSSLNGITSADRWNNAPSGSGNTLSQQTHTVGQSVVPGNPSYFARNVTTSVAGAGNFAVLNQKIERVSTFSGRTVTVTFYAKADSNKNIAIELFQSFGTGGSPSSDVNAIGSQLIPLTTSFQKFSKVISIPSISGKTLGTGGNDFLSLAFWFDAGSNFSARSAGLGQQSGTFDISHISVVDGDATGETNPFCARHLGLEQRLCFRYFQRVNTNVRGPASGAGQTFGCTVSHSGMRTAPAISRVGGGVFVNVSTDALTVLSANESRYEITTAGAGDAAGIGVLWFIDGEI